MDEYAALRPHGTGKHRQWSSACTERSRSVHSRLLINRLTSVNGTTYTWDDNGNLLSDGVNTYTYDSANRLKTINNQSSVSSYQYNGLGDRLQETTNGSTTTFTMDLNMGLTQALSDGTNTYIYGNGRIAQLNTDTDYFLGDALGSVRQLTDASGAVTYASAYDPYGVTTQVYGASQTAYGYTGEYASNEMVYLRARMYSPSMGRFLTKDTWRGIANIPLSFNKWVYTGSNPVNLTDPSGNFPPLWCQSMPNKALYEVCTDLWYGIEPIHYFMMGEFVTGEQGCYQGPSEYRAPGYVEGTGITLASSAVNWLFAIESVYDFASMEHDYYINGSFNIPAIPGIGASDFVWGGVGSQYAGYVYGLRTTEMLNDQYPGIAYVGYLGVSEGTGAALTREGLGVGIGYNGFASAQDPTIRGYTRYISFSAGFELVPVLDVGLGIIQMRSATKNNPSTYLDNKEVKAMNLYLDIVLGRHSVWLSDFTPVLSFAALNSRFPAAIKALKYANVYKELKK